LTAARAARPLVVALAGAALALAVACGGGAEAPVASPGATTQPQATATKEAPSTKGQALSTAEIVRLLRPSVVRVQTESATLDILGRLVPTSGVGTGVIIDGEGHILTNNHVVSIDGRPARRIIVTLDDGSTLDAQIVGTDSPTDLAVLKIWGLNLTPAKLGKAADLQVGDDVVAIGYALDLEGAYRHAGRR